MKRTVKKPSPEDQDVFSTTNSWSRNHMDRCGSIPSYLFLGMGTGLCVWSCEKTVPSHWGEVTGWLVLVTAAVGMQNACQIPLLGTPEDFDGTLPVFTKCLGFAKPQMILLSHFFCLSSALPFLCVQRDGIHVFQGPLLTSPQCDSSRRLLEVPRVGVLCS